MEPAIQSPLVPLDSKALEPPKTAGSRRLEHAFTAGQSQSEIFSLQYDPSDQYLAAGYGDGHIRIFNTDSGMLSFDIDANVVGSQVENASGEKPVTNLRWKPQASASKTLSMLVSVQADGYLQYWHVSSGKMLYQKQEEPENSLRALDFSRSGQKFATAGQDRKVRIYDDQTKELVKVLHEGPELPGHSNRVFCIKFDPLEENMLYTGGWDKTVQIYDLRQEGPVASLSGPMVTGDSIEVHPADHYLVTGCFQSQENIKIWDLRTFGCTKVLDWEGKGYRDPVPEDYNVLEHSVDSPELKKPHSKTMINTLKFSRRLDMILAGGSGKNEVRAFDLKTGEVVAQVTDLDKSVLCMDFANTKDQFAFGSVDSCARVMNFSNY